MSYKELKIGDYFRFVYGVYIWEKKISFSQNELCLFISCNKTRFVFRTRLGKYVISTMYALQVNLATPDKVERDILLSGYQL